MTSHPFHEPRTPSILARTPLFQLQSISYKGLFLLGRPHSGQVIGQRCHLTFLLPLSHQMVNPAEVQWCITCWRSTMSAKGGFDSSPKRLPAVSRPEGQAMRKSAEFAHPLPIVRSVTWQRETKFLPTSLRFSATAQQSICRGGEARARAAMAPRARCQYWP